MYDITATINGHAEAMLAQTSLRSLQRSVEFACAQGLTVQMLGVLDNADALTREIFQEYAAAVPEFTILDVSFGDLGFARNAAAATADSRFIAFLDADDIWGESWLFAAHQAAIADPRQVVWHPEVSVYFGMTPNVFLHRDMEDKDFHIADLAHTNLWTSPCFTSTDFLRSVPYKGTDLKNNYGYEDWTWNVDVIQHHGLHKVVPDTYHAIRRRSSSLLRQTTAAQCIPRPTYFFRDIVAASQSL